MAKEKPILFNGDMVRAILYGRKTQTRRPVNIDMANAFDPPRGKDDVADGYPWFEDGEGNFHKAVGCCPFGQVGDRIWVREKVRVLSEVVRGRCVARYESDGIERCVEFPDRLKPVAVEKCIPNGCHREAARIVLEITNIRVERVQDISEDDAMAEGSPWEDCWVSYVQSFESIWDACYSARGLGWDANPWVWVVEFKKVNQ